MKMLQPKMILLGLIVLTTMIVPLSVHAVDPCEEEVGWILVQNKEDRSWYVHNGQGGKISLNADIKIFDCNNDGHSLQSKFDKSEVNICTQKGNKSKVVRLNFICG